MSTTWDGKPIAPEPPFGAAIVVYRKKSSGLEFLLLHRAHKGPDYEGDWAWTPPSGARQPGETIGSCAVRELFEEAGLTTELRPINVDSEWAVYASEVDAGAIVKLHDEEHDRYEWVSLDEALRRCKPKKVADGIAAAAQAISNTTNSQ